MPAAWSVLWILALLPAAAVALWPLLVGRLLARSRAARREVAASVSVLVPVCGDEPGLAAGLRSVLAAEWPGAELEVVVIAGQRTDPALAVAWQACAGAGERARVIVAGGAGDDAPGKAAQIAAGVAVSHGSWIVMLDSDARLPDLGWVRRFCAPLADPGIGLVSCVPVCRDLQRPAARLLAATIEPDLLGSFAMLDAAGWLALANGSCLAIRREMLQRCRGLEAMRGRLLMDTALARAVRRTGGQVCVHDEALPVDSGRIGWRAAWEQSHRWQVAILRGLPLPAALGFAWLRSATPLALALALFGGSWGAWAGAAAIGLRLGVAWSLRRRLGTRLTPVDLTAQVAADLVAGLTWIVAALDPHVMWRGRRWRVRGGATVELPRSAARVRPRPT
ncbi:MAG TPA: glycosyltransferase [Terriglobales bacterium]|nr:glycosyltransferase [Terriglobales bacterium]